MQTHTHIDLTITLNHNIWQFNFSSLVFIWTQPPPMEASASLPSSVLPLCCHSLLSSLNSVSVIVRPGWSPWLLPSAMFSAPVVIRSFSDAKPISLFPCWAHLNREPGRENTQSMVTIKRNKVKTWSGEATVTLLPQYFLPFHSYFKV